MGSTSAKGLLICIRCRFAWVDGPACPRCSPGEMEPEAEEGTGAPEEAASEVHWRELAPVFEAPHEIAAISVRAALEAEGIQAVVRSALVPGYGGMALTMSGCWGWVLVPSEEAARARSVIEAYLRSLGMPVPEGDGSPRV